MKQQGAKKNRASKKAGVTKKIGAAKKGGVKTEAAKAEAAKTNEGAKKGGGAPLADALKSLTEGLSYQSESDYPVEPYARASGVGASGATPTSCSRRSTRSPRPPTTGWPRSRSTRSWARARPSP